MEIMEPAKAARIMPPEPMTIPLPRRNTITRETTSFAPEEIPSTKGPAMGFAKKVCKRNPETDSAPPRIAAAIIRGRRISQMMRLIVGSSPRPVRTFKSSPAVTATLPRPMFQTANAARSRTSRAKESLALMCVFMFILLTLRDTGR